MIILRQKKYRQIIWAAVGALVVSFLLGVGFVCLYSKSVGFPGTDYGLLKSKVIRFDGKEANFLMAKYLVSQMPKERGSKILNDHSLIYQNDQGGMTVIDTKENRAKWLFYGTSSVDEVSVFGDKVFIVGAKDNQMKVFSFNIETGVLLQTIPLVEYDGNVFAKIFTHDNELYVLTGKYCFATGCESEDGCPEFAKWSRNHQKITANKIFKINTDTGKIIWSYEYLDQKFEWWYPNFDMPSISDIKFQDRTVSFSLKGDACTYDSAKVDKTYKLDAQTGEEVK